MIDLDELERLEREAAPAPWKTSLTKVASGEWEYQLIAERGHAAKPYSDFSLIVAARNALPDLIAELRTLRARVAELEADRQAGRDRVLGARVREIASQHDAHLDMYLRDRLAEKAIQGLLANPSGPIQANGMSGWGLCNCTIEQVADFAWHIADHMLKARGGSDAG